MALADHLVANPLDWRVLLDDDDALSTPARAARIAASVGADVDDPVTGTGGAPGHGHRRRRDGGAAGGLPARTHRDRRPRPRRRPRHRDGDPRARPPGRPDPAGRPGDRRGRPAGRRRADCRLAIIAMGKAGGRELNYVSDVDVIFVAEPGDEAVAGDRGDAGRRRRCGSAGRSPGRSTRRCGPKGATARWCARWPATRPTTSAGPAPGSSRRC